jgi:hypothetical protein
MERDFIIEEESYVIYHFPQYFKNTDIQEIIIYLAVV